MNLYRDCNWEKLQGFEVDGHLVRDVVVMNELVHKLKILPSSTGYRIFVQSSKKSFAGKRFCSEE